MAAQFEEISFWVTGSIQAHRRRQASEQKVPIDSVDPPVVSLSFMYDDVNLEKSGQGPPAQHIELILGAAAATGVHIDYIAREGAYRPAAERMVERLYEASEEEQFPAAGGRRRGISATGGAIFTYVELHDLLVPSGDSLSQRSKGGLIKSPASQKNKGEWACPTLASMWQLHRLGWLGMLTSFAMPEPVLLDSSPGTWETWDEVPAVLQCRPNAAPFIAQRTVSVLPSDFLPVEAAVRVIAENLLHNTPFLSNRSTQSNR